jgi:hypothetical protein
MSGRDLLRRQLELVRFEKAIDYVTGAAGSRKHLNAQELAAINAILTNAPVTAPSDVSPWRQEPAVIQLPSGRQETFALLNNPIFSCRDLLAGVVQRAREGEVEAAAAQCYAQLMRSHFFQDANRRTAVAATYWLLLENGIKISPLGLLEIGVGDLADPSQVEALERLVRATIQIAKHRQ